MNERIRELLIEAHKQTNGGIYNGHLSQWTEKFAELIIDECCLKLIDMQDNARGMHNYYGHAALQIKQHFKDKV